MRRPYPSRIRMSIPRAAVNQRAARKASRALAGLDDPEDDDLETTGTSADVEDDESDGGSHHLERIDALVSAANAEATATMLYHVRSMNETAFEHLVGDVLRAALRADSVRVTQKSRDGGIDGLLYFDALQIRVAVFEAKRYADGNVVTRSQIDAFATAARRKRAAHAIFVTSSSFSSEAKEAARDESIRLIDGIAFVELMAEHGIGLRPRRRFVVYEVDPAWDVETDSV